MRIKRENTIAVVIDIQEKLYPYIYDNEVLTDKVSRLIKGLKVLGIEILVTEQYSKGLGVTIKPVQESLGDYRHLEKMSFSCCGLSDFDSKLSASGKMYIIVCGIESHVCVLQTVLDLCGKGYTPVLVEDCVSSRNPNDKKIAIERMRAEGAIITTYESILFELLEVSGTEEFKAISKIVK
ncbi:MAG: isochorismatase family protein [Ignavibacteria bacterium]|nr:isochorismatase family protein [Ignavibacteria bacterium]